MKRRLVLLIGITLAFWLVVFYPAGLLGGREAQVYCSAALGICLVPALITLIWTGWAEKQPPEQQLLVVLGGTGLRMFFVLGCGLFLYLVLPNWELLGWHFSYHQDSFWTWLLVFYLFTLAVEMGLILGRGVVAPGHPAEGGPTP